MSANAVSLVVSIATSCRPELTHRIVWAAYVKPFARHLFDDASEAELFNAFGGMVH